MTHCHLVWRKLRCGWVARQMLRRVEHHGFRMVLERRRVQRVLQRRCLLLIARAQCGGHLIILIVDSVDVMCKFSRAFHIHSREMLPSWERACVARAHRTDSLPRSAFQLHAQPAKRFHIDARVPQKLQL